MNLFKKIDWIIMFGHVTLFLEGLMLKSSFELSKMMPLETDYFRQ